MNLCDSVAIAKCVIRERARARQRLTPLRARDTPPPFPLRNRRKIRRGAVTRRRRWLPLSLFTMAGRRGSRKSRCCRRRRSSDRKTDGECERRSDKTRIVLVADTSAARRAKARTKSGAARNVAGVEKTHDGCSGGQEKIKSQIKRVVTTALISIRSIQSLCTIWPSLTAAPVFLWAFSHQLTTASKRFT